MYIKPKEKFMSKRSLLFLVVATAMTISCAHASVTFGVDNSNMGRVPIGESSYSTNRTLRMERAQSNAVNDAMMEFGQEENGEKNVTDVVKRSSLETPAPSFKSSFSNTEERTDASGRYGFDAYNPSGVNDSKTIYTDDLGRLHFFGKANLIKE